MDFSTERASTCKEESVQLRVTKSLALWKFANA